MQALKALLVAAALSLLGAQAASAQFYVGAHAGTNLTHEGERNDVDGLSYEPGGIVGAHLGYRLTPFLRIEGEATYRENDFDDFRGSPITGDVSSWAFMGSVYFDFQTGTPWTPYVGAGAGVAVATIDSGGEDDDEVTAFQFGAGVAYDFTPNLALTLDYRLFGTENPEVELSGVPVEIEYVNSAFLIGLRYNF